MNFNLDLVLLLSTAYAIKNTGHSIIPLQKGRRHMLPNAGMSLERRPKSSTFESYEPRVPIFKSNVTQRLIRAQNIAGPGKNSST